MLLTPRTYALNLFGNYVCHVWTKLGVPRRFQLAICTFFYVESDSAVGNSKVLQGNESNWISDSERKSSVHRVCVYIHIACRIASSTTQYPKTCSKLVPKRFQHCPLTVPALSQNCSKTSPLKRF